MFELDGCKTTIQKYNCGGEEGGQFRNVDDFPPFLSVLCLHLQLYAYVAATGLPVITFRTNSPEAASCSTI